IGAISISALTRCRKGNSRGNICWCRRRSAGRLHSPKRRVSLQVQKLLRRIPGSVWPRSLTLGRRRHFARCRRMDFTALRYFSETAHLGSVRAASERLHISPSAISRQIAKLEHELRTAMFDRRADGMKLTAAGEILQSKVEAMVRELARVKSHIAALQQLQAG